MTKAEIIANNLGSINSQLDDDNLKTEIERLRKPSFVELEAVKLLHDWLENKRHSRQCCRVVGESRNGKTLACNAFRLRHKPEQQPGKAPKVPAEFVRLDTKDLQLMLPPQGTGMKLEPIRLCPSCYIESPCHQIQWQFKTSNRCFIHNLTLLSECPFCGARFQTPSEWKKGKCHRCFTPIQQMIAFQKKLKFSVTE